MMLIKAAVFKAVRMDHIAWESYEPSNESLSAFRIAE